MSRDSVIVLILVGVGLALVRALSLLMRSLAAATGSSEQPTTSASGVVSERVTQLAKEEDRLLRAIQDVRNETKANRMSPEDAAELERTYRADLASVLAALDKELGGARKEAEARAATIATKATTAAGPSTNGADS